MARTYKTPGVYVEEISKFPPSVAQVETAIPAFIGFTQRDSFRGQTLVNKPRRIRSLNDYEEIFGLPPQTLFTNQNNAANGILLKQDTNGDFVLDGEMRDPFDNLQLRMYYYLQLYFANGGGPCYIVSCGSYTNASFNNTTAMESALTALRKEDEPTIILFTDAASLDKANFYSMYTRALTQAAELMDRVVIVDVYPDLTDATRLADFKAGKLDLGYSTGAGTLADDFRTGIGNNNLSYGAAYFPWLKTILPYFADESQIPVSCPDAPLNTVTVLRKYPEPGETEVKILRNPFTMSTACSMQP